MNPNDQQRDFGQPNESTSANFGTPAHPENLASAPPSTEPAPNMTSPESQSFGQPTTAFQPPIQQPAFPAPAVAPVGQPPVHSGENPGQTLGIISIVLSFIGLSLIGLILGIVSRKQSKTVGASTTLGTAGMVIGIVSTVLTVLFFLLVFVPVILIAANTDTSSTNNGSDSFSSSEERTSALDLSSQAATIVTKAEAYKAKASDYPQYSWDFDKYPESKLDSDTHLYTTLVTNKSVSYLYCEPGAAQVVYYEDATESKLNITALGTAGSTEACVTIN